mgnify:CR=1 FL=1|jgi:hypothetical protein|tara:strand:+ start:1616 stop:1834 length:219 start_codon:yes stop_codon:yes gene_type:complete
MADKKTLEERGVVALESISESVTTFEDVILDLDLEGWSERLEWYLNEFYLVAKSKVISSETTRPERKVTVKK